MRLECSADYELVLALYDQYRNTLKKEGLISVDQLVLDYLGYLDSFRWDARRGKSGYDAIFVDEYHLFNRMERAAFPSLTRGGDETAPAILMALDPRQSPRAFFIEAAFGEGRAVPLLPGHSRQLRDFEFNDVFRYTPEIARLLTFVNNHFPEHDLSEEWLPSEATSALPSGSVPIVGEFADETLLYEAAVARAEKIKQQNGKVSVAIVTLSHKSFEVISRAVRFEKKLYIVDSRDSLNRLQYVGSKIVFSMPEYVAGVQFDHVIVTDVNALDDVGRPTSLGRSRFGSALYLAASRAKHTVSIFGNARYQGLAAVVKKALNQGIVQGLSK